MERVDALGQLDILSAQSASVMGGEGDTHPVVDIEPFGMVPGLFGGQRHPRHEGEGRREVLETKFPRDRVCRRVVGPGGQFGQGRVAARGREFFSHVLLLKRPSSSPAQTREGAKGCYVRNALTCRSACRPIRRWAGRASKTLLRA